MLHLLSLLLLAPLGQQASDSTENTGEASRAGEAPRVVENPALPAPFRQLAAKRPDGSEARIYVADPVWAEPEGAASDAPLFIYVEGSGAQSLFTTLPDGRAVSGLLGLVAERATSAYRVAAIDKRGVEFGYRGSRGTSDPSLSEYNRYATLEARTADVRLLISALVGPKPPSDQKVVLMGHSEGADVAARVAGLDPRVTHIAFLSGGGPAQFFDFFIMTRNRMKEEGASAEDIEIRLDELENEIRDVLAKPNSETDFFMGHAYKRWSTFATTGSADSLVETDARIFLAHGSADTSVPIESFDYLVVRLLCAGKDDVAVRRYPDRDHSFIPVDAQPGYDGIVEVIEEVIIWSEEE